MLWLPWIEVSCTGVCLWLLWAKSISVWSCNSWFRVTELGYLYRVMLLWQSLHVQVCVLCRCDCEQSLRWQVHVISDLFEQSLHVYNTLVWCHSDGYDAVRAWSVYWYLWDVMELRQSWCYRHNLLWFITGLGNLLVKVLLKGCNSPGQRLWCDGEWEVLTLTFVG